MLFIQQWSAFSPAMVLMPLRSSNLDIECLPIVCRFGFGGQRADNVGKRTPAAIFFLAGNMVKDLAGRNKWAQPGSPTKESHVSFVEKLILSSIQILGWCSRYLHKQNKTWSYDNSFTGKLVLIRSLKTYHFQLTYVGIVQKKLPPHIETRRNFDMKLFPVQSSMQILCTGKSFMTKFLLVVP